MTQNPNIKERIDALRTVLNTKSVDAFYIPRADEFQNEYVPPCYDRLKYMTGFTGSAGSCMISKTAAGFFTDGRYTLQAQDEVDASLFDIYSISPNQAPTPTLTPLQWIEKFLPDGGRLGIDPWVISPKLYEQLATAVSAKNGSLFNLDANLVDLIWQDQPAKPTAPVQVHDLKYAGISHADKIADIAKKLTEKECSALILTFPEDIAWLLNIRGGDVDFNPLPLSYAILHDDGHVDLFIDPKKLSDNVENHLGANVDCYPFEMFEKALSNLKDKIWVDPNTSPYAVSDILKKKALSLRLRPSPIQMAKAIKNKTEIDGTIAAHIRDGVAITQYLHLLSQSEYLDKNTEISGSDDLHNLRRQQDHFKDLSFDTISGAGAAGAIIHYRATAKSDKPLKSGPLYLCDSGGQYLDGTTDITRTVAVDELTPEMIDAYTRVLKGHIQVAMSTFTAGTTGKPLDVKARAALKEVGLDYAHGTGHGVGSYLCVHEGPCGIHSRSQTALVPGMIVSNEPGYYKNGEYGIRIENLIVVTETDEPNTYGFKTLTMAPIDLKCINADLLAPQELDWLNSYHKEVCETLTPVLSAVNPETAKWLKTVTAPLSHMPKTPNQVIKPNKKNTP